ncbi:TPA: hypothetical protein ACUB6M_005378, partial [Citrobacter freundii]
MTQTIKKMSLPGLILMIFTSVFGFAKEGANKRGNSS